MTFIVRFLAGAQDDLDDIEKAQRRLIISKTTEVLSLNPFPHGTVVKQLTGIKPPLSRLRVGQWRVFFEIHGHDIMVLAVSKKERAVRAIRRLRR